MITNHHIHEDPTLQPDISTEPEIHNPVPEDSSIISFKVTRQTLVLSALALLLGISVFETFELTRLHQALRAWQTLPAATASAPAPTSGGSALPSQVGGC